MAELWDIDASPASLRARSDPAPAAHVALIDKRPLLRDCMALSLRRAAPDISVTAYSSAEELAATSVSLAVIWLDRGGSEGIRSTIATVETIGRHAAGTPIVAFLEHEDKDLAFYAMNAGLNLVRWKSASREVALASVRLALAGGKFASSELVQCCVAEADRALQSAPDHAMETASGAFDLNIRLHLNERRGVDPFTHREQQIVSLLNRGLQNKTIAFELGISICTVKVHVQNIMKKLNARNRSQVAFFVRQQSL